MPKIKTRSSVAKRFHVTKNGKVKHAQMGRRHKLSTKTTKRKRLLRTPAYGAPSIENNIKKMLPYT